VTQGVVRALGEASFGLRREADIDIHGELALLGSYLYDISDPERPAFIQRLFPEEDGGTGFYGWAVELNESYAVITARGSDLEGENSGTAHVSDIRDITNIQQIARLGASDIEPFFNLGRDVAIDGDTVVLSAGDDGVYVYQIPEPGFFFVTTGVLAMLLRRSRTPAP
jgi:hypothetical protein